MYEVYEQDEFRVDNQRTTRFYTENKRKAFHFMDEKNKIAGRNIWRVGLCINNRLAFDIDEPNIENVKEIMEYYAKLFGDGFKCIKSLHGYHLIGKRIYENFENWLFDECRILNPYLERRNMQEYILSIQRWYREQSIRERTQNDKQEFLKQISTEFKNSGLFCGNGNFDIMFSINVIFRGKHCIRISKKCKEDKPEVICIC